jgi:hypothetical protein
MRFYRAGETMLTRIYRDKAALPAGRRQVLTDRDRHLRDTLLEPFDTDRGRRHRLRAVLAHAVSFWTWHSLCAEHGLSDREAVEAMDGAHGRDGISFTPAVDPKYVDHLLRRDPGRLECHGSPWSICSTFVPLARWSKKPTRAVTS